MSSAAVVTSPYFSSDVKEEGKHHEGADESADAVEAPSTAVGAATPAVASKKRARRKVSAEFRDSRAGKPSSSRKPHPFANRASDGKADRAGRVRKKRRLLAPLAAATNDRCSHCQSSGGAAAEEPVFRFPTLEVSLCGECRSALLISKTEAKLRFGLTESDLKPLSSDRVPNPLRGSFSPMVLFQRTDVEAATLAKYGTLDQVWTADRFAQWRQQVRERHNKRKAVLAAQRKATAVSGSGAGAGSGTASGASAGAGAGASAGSAAGAATDGESEAEDSADGSRSDGSQDDHSEDENED